jgi:hypothetical protein
MAVVSVGQTNLPASDNLWQFAPIQITPSTDTQWIIEAADGLRVHVPAHCE